METKEMEQIYQRVATILNEMIPEPWIKIYLYAEVGEDGRQVFFYYYPERKSEPVYNLEITKYYGSDQQAFEELEDDLYDCFTELWNEFEQQKQEKWTNLTFTLDHTGDINIEYSYENLSEVDSYKQQIIWEYKNLGIIADGPRPKEIIDKFLAKSKE
ncbi:DUF600 family protein [Peribacillus cavernae]|uniref:DUF600 family protein n=1 Tax=Peribacillus cavernae TaxID=1674310 RepID=A0A433HC53_9BACI|nr:immunity protein YezG family protein [Peribacillus cavernae]MDQ0221030.1 uncharacterized protein (TIGR01741 family) [Peribacillus cavernae]RUQ25806.1 DUF600 family protein [Peribacillus cavernae]